MSQFSVMVVDDDEIDRELMRRDIKKTGLDVAFFEKTNGQEALDFFRDYESNRRSYPDSFPPQVTFLDINMPLLGGFEFLEQYAGLRKTLDVKGCIVVMVSSSDIDRDRDNALGYDFVSDYLVKGKYGADELKTLLLKLTQTS